MKLNLTQVANQLLQSENVAILCHVSPDGDTLGSGFALWHALKQLGKQANVYCADPISQKYEYMTKHYQHETFLVKTVVSVDVADNKLLGGLIDQFPTVDLAIDHHPSNTMFAKETYLNEEAGANCENMFEILQEMGVNITREIADCLFTGIITDTGCFRFSNTRALTHTIAATLMEKGAQSAFLCRLFFGTKSKSVMALEQEVLKTLEYHFNGAFCLIAVTNEMLQQTGATQEDYDFISSIPPRIEGIKIGVTIKEKETNIYKLSVRTHDQYEANEICALLGGGGHKRAAGCTIEGSLGQVKELVLNTVQRYMNEKGNGNERNITSQ